MPASQNVSRKTRKDVVKPQPVTELISSGKARNRHAFSGYIFEATDHLSVFGRIIKEDVPFKGVMMNAINQHNKVLLNEAGFITDYIGVPDEFFISAGFSEKDIGRLSYAKALAMLPFEFMVRAYMTDSIYKVYRKKQPYHGYTFPKGLTEDAKLPEPIVLIAVQENENCVRAISKEDAISKLALWLLDNSWIISSEGLKETFGGDMSKFASEVAQKMDLKSLQFGVDSATESWEQATIALAYCYAKKYITQAYAISLAAFTHLSSMYQKHGIILVDSKFKFGVDNDDNVVLAGEVGTPDSSRLSPRTKYHQILKLVSLDKQIIRDYCSFVGFNGAEDQETPKIPNDIWQKVTATYIHIASLICGEDVIAKYRNILDDK